jgi:hypothetical protein
MRYLYCMEARCATWFCQISCLIVRIFVDHLALWVQHAAAVATAVSQAQATML